MDKHELVGLTIDRLLEHFKMSPESFEYLESSNHPTIVWRPKVQLGDYMSTIVEDPNNASAVTVSFNYFVNEMYCNIYVKVPEKFDGAKPDVSISSRRMFENWRSNYRKFKKLKKMIIARDRYKENMIYLKKLSSVFPDTLDDRLLKD